MAVKRIVTNIAAGDLGAADKFYGDILGMKTVMDLGWIITFGTDGKTTPQISVAIEGGSGTDVPDVSIEVDNLEDIFRSVKKEGYAVEYGPVTEEWGVRRFYVRDPFGRLINILMHAR